MLMRRKTVGILIAFMTILLLCACGKGTMYIQGTTSTKEEVDAQASQKENLGEDCEQYSYQFSTDDSVNYMVLRVYALQDGQWDKRAELGRVEDLAPGNHRVSMAFDRLPAGIFVSANGFGNTYKPELTEEVSNMEGCSVIARSRMDIIPGEELPLVVECYGMGASVNGCDLQDFFAPENLAVRDYSYVYAVTIYFE